MNLTLLPASENGTFYTNPKRQRGNALTPSLALRVGVISNRGQYNATIDVLDAGAACRSRPAPFWPWILVCAAAALCIDLGNFHQLQNSDSIIPVLSSLCRWTPFFWGQNRFGQLLPLLAIPFEHPLTNLLVQTGLAIFAGLSVFFLVPRYLQRDAHWPKTGAVLAVLFLLLAPEEFQFNLLSGCQPYGTSLALSLWGMILIEEHANRRNRRGRLAAAWALIMVAHWVNPTSAWVLIPLVVGRYWLDRQIERREFIVTVTALACSCMTSIGVSLLIRTCQLYPEDVTTSFQLADPRLWPNTWWELNSSLCSAAGWLMPILIVLTLGAILAARCSLVGPRASVPWRTGFLSVLAAYLTYLAITGSLTWVQMNSRHYRYMLPAFTMLAAGLASAFWKPFWEAASIWLDRTRRAQRLTMSALSVAVASATMLTYGLPSLATVRHHVDVSCGRYSEDIRSAECTHVVGSYWKIWPAVFHAFLWAYERGEPQYLWAEGLRAGAIRDQWSDMPVDRIKLAFLSDGAEVDILAETFDSRIFDLEGMSRQRHGAIEVLVPADVFLVWMRGFRRCGVGETDRTGLPSAELWICNRTDSHREVALEMNLTLIRGETFPLSITSELFCERLEMRPELLEQQRRLVVPPGRNVVAFQSAAPIFHTWRRSGRIYYRIAGPHLTSVQNAAHSDPATRK